MTPWPCSAAQPWRAWIGPEEEKAANDDWTQLQFEAAQSTTPMTEIDLRSDNRNPGIPLDPLVVGRDIYRLLAIFGASREIAARRSGEDDEGSVYGYSIRAFELSEVGRLLVSLAACCRNAWDRRSESIDDALAACAESSEGIVRVNRLEPGSTAS